MTRCTRSPGNMVKPDFGCAFHPLPLCVKNRADSMRKGDGMKIGILGAGIVGSSLGKALVRVGHEVMFSTRNPMSDKMKTLLAEIGGAARAGSTAETVAFGEVVVAAIGWQNGLESVLNSVPDWS